MEIPYEFVLSLPVIRKKRVFPPLTKDEIQRTVAQIDRSTVMGKRDYAIILLGARNGLRGCDIIHLKLTDIDWRAGEIRLIQKKTGNPLVLPLLPDVGEALKEYILNGRPDSSSEFIFEGDASISALQQNSGINASLVRLPEKSRYRTLCP